MKISVVSVFLNILVFFSSQADGAPTSTQFAVESPWQELLEMAKEFIKEGYPDAGVPPLDPFEIQHTNLDLTGDYFKLKANIRDGILHGLSDFEVNKLEVSTEELSLDFNVYFPYLNFSAEYYEMEGDIIDAFPLAGQGVLQFVVYDFALSTKIYFKKSEIGESFLIDRFENPGFSVTQIISKTEYDGNFDGILNAMVEELLAGYLNRFNGFLAGAVADRIIDPINGIYWRNFNK